jgi:hypothetical protein
MKHSTDQLLTWYFAAATAAGMHNAASEARYRDVIARLRGKERSGISAAIKQSVRDILRIADMWPLDTYLKVEAELFARGFPSLEAMEANLCGGLTRVLKRGKINNLEEFYFITELLSDTDSDLTDLDRKRLELMLGKYAEMARNA